MKKILFSLVLFTLLFTMAACGDTSSTETNAGPSDSLPTSMELLVGTFRLEDTDLAVTADQAKTLLPLWEMLQSLSASSTAATEEIDAVVNQIKSTMTSEQMDEITSLNLTQQDVMALMGQNGGFGSNGTQGSSTPMVFNGMPDDSSRGGGFPSGGMPSGGMPAGGPPPGDFPADAAGVGGTTGMSATPQAVRSNDMARQIPAPLLNALIELLQKKIQP